MHVFRPHLSCSFSVKSPIFIQFFSSSSFLLSPTPHSHAAPHHARPSSFSLDPVSTAGPSFHSLCTNSHRRQNSITEEDIFSTLGGLDLGSDHGHSQEQQQHSPGTIVNSSSALAAGGSGGSSHRLDFLGSNASLSSLAVGSGSTGGPSGGGLPVAQAETSRTLYVRNVALGVGDEELHQLMSVSVSFNCVAANSLRVTSVPVDSK